MPSSYYPSRPGCGTSFLLGSSVCFHQMDASLGRKVSSRCSSALSRESPTNHVRTLPALCFNTHTLAIEQNGSAASWVVTHHPILADSGLQSFSCLDSVRA